LFFTRWSSSLRSVVRSSSRSRRGHPLHPLPRLGQRPQDRGGQALEALLQHVIRRAPLQRLDRDLLAEGAGNEDEGRRWAEPPGHGERAQAIEGGQHVIGQNEIEPAFRDRTLKLVGRDDPVDRRLEPEPRNGFGHELGVERAVLQEEDAQHAVELGHGPAHQGPGSRLRGGGSLRMAQKTPRSWMASKNSRNPTGFTTKALTPSS
jgi:hypothetical protein